MYHPDPIHLSVTASSIMSKTSQINRFARILYIDQFLFVNGKWYIICIWILYMVYAWLKNEFGNLIFIFLYFFFSILVSYKEQHVLWIQSSEIRGLCYDEMTRLSKCVVSYWYDMTQHMCLVKNSNEFDYISRRLMDIYSQFFGI